MQTFTPESSRDFTVTFTNTTGAPAAGVSLSIAVPSNQWTSVVSGTTETSKTFAQQVAPGASVSATFKVTSGPVTFNGDLVGNASWTNPASGRKQVETAVEKVRNASPVKINEFRVTSGAPGNLTNSFIELYNAGSQSVDISNWTLTEHPAAPGYLLDGKDPGWNEACGQRLLPARSLQLRAGGPCARGRQHPPCQEHGWNVDWRYHHHRYWLQHGNAQDRKPGDGCHQPHNAVATPSRRTGDHNSCRLDQCAG